MAPVSSPQLHEEAAQISPCCNPGFCGVKVTSPHCPIHSHPGELWDIHTVVLEASFPFHIHSSSSPELLRKDFFFFSPSFKIFVTCGTYRWDEEGFAIPATTPGHGEGGWGMGPGARISSFLGSRRRRVRCSPRQHVFSAAFGLAEDTGGVGSDRWAQRTVCSFSGCCLGFWGCSCQH